MVGARVGERARVAYRLVGVAHLEMLERHLLEQAGHQHVCLRLGQQSHVGLDPDLRAEVAQQAVGEGVVGEDGRLFPNGQVENA
jgi:hypothetical protein